MDDAIEHGLLRSSPDALWLLAPDGSTLYGNARLEKLLGRTVEELTALGSASALVVARPEDRAAHEAHVQEMRAHHPGRQNDELIAVRPDGTHVWLMVSWAPHHDDDGELVGYLHRLTEYTERRELLDQLSRRESELAAAQAMARLGSWSHDLAHDRTTWSAELYRVFDLDPEQFQPSYEKYLSRAHPDDRDGTRAIIEAALKDQATYSYEGRIVTPSGEERWVRSTAVVERDEHGAPVSLHGTCQDITDLRRAADETTEVRRRLMLFSSIAEAANSSSNLEHALGRAWLALESVDEWRSMAVWGRRDPEALPELLHDLSRDDEHALDPCDVAEVTTWASGEVVVAPCSTPGRSLVWLPVSLAGTTVRLIQLEGRVDEVDDAIRGLLEQISVTLGRVAERERHAAELAAARDDAMAASAHKSAFLATMSHEIRTPMNGVIGLNDLLLRTPLDAHQQRLADGLRSAGLTLLALINDILDLSKIEAGAIELEREPFEVSEVLDRTATVISPPAQEKRLELVLSCDPALPRTLVGDRVRLGQVLANLASNAVKFTDQGEVVVELALDPSSTSERIVLRGEVRDTGIGIGSNAASLFEAFTQADRSTTRNHGGTGLGLAISRRLVQDMGGSIGADERPGGGSTFWFSVPLEVDPTGGSLPLPPLGRRRCLLVDDNPRAAAATERQLVAWGLDVETTSDADDALRALRAAPSDAPFELALIDLHMPDVDGLTLGRRITELVGHEELTALPMVLLSDDPSSRLDDVATSGFHSIVDKPLRPDELHRALRDALEVGAGAPASDRAAVQQAALGAQLALHVLVVEDNPVNQLVAQGLLEGLGCTSTVATNGEEAVVALAPGHAFDLVLMDCRMPRMDGYAATRAVRERERGTETHIPIIAMTASALSGERDRCLEAGMDDFMTKPVDPASLARLVSHWAPAAQGTDGPEPLRGDAGTSSPATAPERPSRPEPPVLDHERVEMLRELVRDGVSFFDRTRTSFLSRVDSTVAAIRTARDARDLEQVAFVAHQLKGSALNLGLSRVGSAAGQVEDAAAAADDTATAREIQALERALIDGVAALGEATSGSASP